MRVPVTHRGDVVERYHGEEVADPYRWLEDLDSEDTRAWVRDQNAATFAHLESLPTRELLRVRIAELWNYERYGLPVERGGRYFFSKNDGLQNQSVLYWTTSLDARPQVLLDPNSLSNDGTVSLSRYSLSHDGKKLAYGLSVSGSDWITWHVRDVDRGEDTDDRLEWSKFSGASWAHDDTGFYYSRYDAPKDGEEYEGANFHQKLYFHRLGTTQSEDELIFEDRDHPEWGFSGSVTDDGDYLVISVWRGTEEKNLLFVKRLSDGLVVPLVDQWTFDYRVIDNIGERFYLLTDDGASLRRIVCADLSSPSALLEVLPNSEHVLQGASIFGETIYAVYLEDAHASIRRFGLTGEPVGAFDLPGLGSVAGFGGERDAEETFFTFESFGQPSTVYRLDLKSGEASVWKQPEVSFDPKRFETEQVFYTSKDGTRIPMFISKARETELDGERPTYLYGYGGFNVSLTPSFSPALVAWFELGGLLAIPNLRGGGEYGRDWHEAGTLTRKQNVFDDFVAAAEWLKQNGYSRTERLAISGRSNGGLLVGATVTQRPDLVAAALPGVGVMDMLRYDQFTIGWAWRSDYGDPRDLEHYRALRAYSPVHNTNADTDYPATLVITADHDDRVVPAHSYKFTAALQHANAGARPVLIRIETKAGHGAGVPTEKKIAEVADSYAFLLHHLGYDEEVLARLSRGCSKS